MGSIPAEKKRLMGKILGNIKRWTKPLLQIQFVRFCITGGLGVITDAGIYHLFRILLNAEENPALLYAIPVFGFTAAVIQNYLINHFWTFGEQTGRKKVSFTSFAKFLAVSVFSLIPRQLLYIAMIRSFSDLSGLAPDIANICGIAAGTVTNFLGSKFIVFRKQEKKID